MKENETTIIESKYQEEWYDTFHTCSICGASFMVRDPNYCPTCGKKIVGKVCGNETVYF